MLAISPAVLRAITAATIVVTLAIANWPSDSGAIETPARSEEADLFDRLDANGDGFVGPEEVPAEKQRMLKRLMRTSDVDNDGRLTSHEFKSSVEPKRIEKPIEKLRENKVPGADALAVLMVYLDQNQDGRVVSGEVPEKWSGAFDALAQTADQNKDGVISRFEFRRAGPQLARTSIRIARRLKLNINAEMKRIGSAGMNAMDRPSPSLGKPTPEMLLTDPATVLEMFEMADGNGDGLVELSEVPENGRERFERLAEHADDNYDGKLNKREFVSGMKTWARYELVRQKDDKKRRLRGEAKISANARKILQRARRLDVDQNGKISRDESRGPLKANFDRVDANGDGQLDLPELKRMADRIGRD